MKKLITLGTAVLFVLILLMNSCSIVKPGSRGIRITLGSVSNSTLNEGIHFKLPFVQHIDQMSVKILKADLPAAAVSKDLQDIKTHIAINYHLLPGKVNTIYKEYAKTPQEAAEIIIAPKVQEITKSIVCRYNTLELISQREKIRTEMQTELKGIVLKYHIVLDELSITNFDFSPQFQASIERKQIAEQDAITAQKKLEQVKFEAEQLIAKARGEAESNKLKQMTLTPMLIEWEKVQKWNGVLPQVTSGDGTFINFKK